MRRPKLWGRGDVVVGGMKRRLKIGSCFQLQENASAKGTTEIARASVQGTPCLKSKGVSRARGSQEQGDEGDFTTLRSRSQSPFCANATGVLRPIAYARVCQ